MTLLGGRPRYRVRAPWPVRGPEGNALPAHDIKSGNLQEDVCKGVCGIRTYWCL
jgi:hypothetical protein